jgi:hypothetical protein
MLKQKRESFSAIVCIFTVLAVSVPQMTLTSAELILADSQNTPVMDVGLSGPMTQPPGAQQTPLNFSSQFVVSEVFEYNTSWLNSQIGFAESQVLLPNRPRVSAFINTDQSVYKPGDLVYVETILFNAITKAPIQVTESPEINLNPVVVVQVTDPNGNQVYSNFATIMNQTATFSY